MTLRYLNVIYERVNSIGMRREGKNYFKEIYFLGSTNLPSCKTSKWT